MQQSRIGPTGKVLQPPLRIIQATDCEIIMLQTALRHYLDFIRSNQELYQQAAPHIFHFIDRLHEQLPPREERIEGL
jgi:hypothetical protein